jgi:hypothetical protein
MRVVSDAELPGEHEVPFAVSKRQTALFNSKFGSRIRE